jgi:hypothetical protein
MQQSGDCLDTPRLDFEAWSALLRSNCGGEVDVTAPNAFAGWMRPLSVCGLTAAAVKIQWGFPASPDLGDNSHRVERTQKSVRLDGSDDYLIVCQVAGQSALTQNDRDVQLAVGDIALVDKVRPVTYFSRNRSAQWLALQLPRKSVVFHLGFEPEGGLSRHGTRAGSVLFDLIRDGHEGDGSSADSYMQLAVYDLLGATFAPSDPSPASRHTDLQTHPLHHPRPARRSRFRPVRGGGRSGDLVTLRAEAPYGTRIHLPRTHIFASLRPRGAPSPSPDVAGRKPACQRNCICFWLSRPHSFRTKISPAIWLCTRRLRRGTW